jgi:long-subunit fatty acid transport protein
MTSSFRAYAFGWLISILVAGVATTPRVSANGFEKANAASARYAGIGTAATSSVTGSEAVIFNPAGLARAQGTELTLDAAFGLLKASSPLISGRVDSKISFIPVGEAALSYGLLKNLGIGIGLTVSGGTGADYGDVSFGPNFAALQPEFRSMLGIAEAAVGAGYEPIEGLRIGAAWRVLATRVDNRFGALLDANTLAAIRFTDASGASFGGFRFGAQYSPHDSGWGIGATLRTPVDFEARGQSSGSLLVSGSSNVTAIPGGDVTLASTFPLQIAFGANEQLSDRLRLYEEYSFTRNSGIRGLNASGASLVINGAPVAVSTFSTSIHWHNMHQLRLGAEWEASETWGFRAGYVFSSQVVPNSEANPFFSPPGAENTFSLGATRQVTAATRLDAAVELDTLNGTASAPPSLDGSYRQHTFAVYLGASHAF